VEFFCAPKDVETLITTLDARKDTTLSYMAVNAAGQVHASSPPGTVTAVQWGAFPNAEVKQPSVLDFESFLAWKDEAFALWDEWAELYSDVEAPQRALIQEIQSVWFLVSVVDNDHVAGDLFTKLTRLY
jgi:methylenetetrahydrofolate reductase (NADPH)